MESIAVFCGSSDGNDTKIAKTAYELGKTIAEATKSWYMEAPELDLWGKSLMGHWITMVKLLA